MKSINKVTFTSRRSRQFMLFSDVIHYLPGATLDLYTLLTRVTWMTINISQVNSQ